MTQLGSLATRIKLSPAEQVAYIRAIIEEFGGDNSRVVVSYATADRSRREVGEKIAPAVSKEWKPSNFVSLYWDLKLLVTLTDKNVNEERLTVAAGDVNKVKLL